MISIIQQWFERIVMVVMRRPIAVLWFTAAITGFLMLGMSRLYIDVSDESLFRPGDHTLQKYQNFQEMFGRDDAILAAIESPRIFSKEFLKKLQLYHDDIEASVPYLDKVTSLLNITSISDRKGELLIDELQELWPQNEQDFAEFRQAVITNPLFRNVIITEDGNMTLVIVRASAFATKAMTPPSSDTASSITKMIADWHNSLFVDKPIEEPRESKQTPEAGSGELDVSGLPPEFTGNANKTDGEVKKSGLSTKQLEMFMAAVREVTYRHQSDDFPIILAGGPVIDAAHLDAIHSDFIKFLGLATLIVFIVLLYLLRRLSAVLIAMLTVTLSLLVTMGVMGWLGSPMTPVSVAIPPLLLTIGVVDSVHFLSLFFAEHNRTGERERAIMFATSRAGIAILFTSLTTAAGFIAFTSADIRPIAEFGFLIAFGVLAALIYTLVLVPAILSKLKFTSMNDTFTLRWESQVRGLFYLIEKSLKHSKKILLALPLLIIAGIPGIMNLEFSHNVLKWFPEDHEVRVNTVAIDNAMQGSLPLEVIVDTKKRRWNLRTQFYAAFR